MRGRREHVHQGPPLGGCQRRKASHASRRATAASRSASEAPYVRSRVQRASGRSPPSAAGSAQPSAAQPGAVCACLGPNLRSARPEPTATPAAAWRRPPRCYGQRPYRPLLVARQRHSHAHPFALLARARARAPRSLGGSDDDMADTDQPRRSSTSWSRETNGGKSAARPATYVLSTNTRTAKRHRSM